MFENSQRYWGFAAFAKGFINSAAFSKVKAFPEKVGASKALSAIVRGHNPRGSEKLGTPLRAHAGKLEFEKWKTGELDFLSL